MEQVLTATLIRVKIKNQIIQRHELQCSKTLSREQPAMQQNTGYYN